MRENAEKWIELCAQAASEQHSEKLMALIKQIAALSTPNKGAVDSKRFAALRVGTN